MKHATILIATSETDRFLRERYQAYGHDAYEGGLPRTPTRCQDPTSMIAYWWFEGYDRAAIRANRTVIEPPTFSP